ncbi:MAG TPA: FAD-dependent monooxygenase [Amycolatopsis sp.]|uniref:FAD-dependent monooxygenase n=1 Tax=Amycolatopsis sp. TaxID=37632 RepID=UPI002B483721|nr:FAD-dependent monooxygenase [Amycolatopsis sp.]HKS47497.1 FAD-dependent monooxygenase [Amycolatopsis sp.]
MDAIIVGGGIGGLATAAFLQQQGVRARVFEQAPELRPVGAGIVLAPNAVRLLRRLGVMEALERQALKVRTGWQFRRWQDGRILLEQDMATCESLYGEAAWLVHRADLLGALLPAVDPDTVHLDHQCADIDQSPSGVTVTFANGASAGGEVLVAADGIHSTIRQQLIGQLPARDSGLCAWRAMIPADRLPERFVAPTQTLWLGPGRHLVHYPVSAGRTINVVAFTPAEPGETVESWSAEGKPGDFRAEFAGWDGMVNELLDAVTQVGRWSVLDRTPIERYVHDRVVLLGDAAHPMLPFFAQGAGQAIEDAATLAACLEQAGDISTALGAYDQVRVPRTAQVQEASHDRAQVNHLPDGPEQQARDRAFAGEDPLRHSDWLYSYDAQREARQAVRAELLRAP